MVALAEKEVAMKKYTDIRFICPVCQRGNNFEIQIKTDSEGNYYLAEKCPRCDHYEDFRSITKKEASRYLLLDDLP